MVAEELLRQENSVHGWFRPYNPLDLISRDPTNACKSDGVLSRYTLWHEQLQACLHTVEWEFRLLGLWMSKAESFSATNSGCPWVSTSTTLGCSTEKICIGFDSYRGGKSRSDKVLLATGSKSPIDSVLNCEMTREWSTLEKNPISNCSSYGHCAAVAKDLCGPSAGSVAVAQSRPSTSRMQLTDRSHPTNWKSLVEWSSTFHGARRFDF